MIRFSKYMWLYFLISSVVLIPGIYSLIRFGLRPGLDFTGGSLLEIRLSHAVPPSRIEEIAKQQKVPLSSVEQSGPSSFLLRIKPEGSALLSAFETRLASQLGQKLDGIRNETVGPILGKELLTKTLWATVVAIVAILTYVAYAFRDIKFGVAAVIALFHDLLVVLGVFSLLGHFLHVEVDTLFVTAFLTTMSFSVHDTIVVFDRIRELLKRGERLPFESVADRALTETINRSVTNSFTIMFMLLALVLLGGSTIHWFVIALLVGTVSGAYSSPFIATPVLILWDRWEKRTF